MMQHQARRRQRQSKPRLRGKRTGGLSLFLKENTAIANMVIGFFVVVLFCCIGLFYESTKSSARLSLPAIQRHQSNELSRTLMKGVAQLPSQFSPKIPYMPIFAKIPNSDQLEAQTLDGSNPTLAGIAVILSKFLVKLDEANRALMKKAEPRKVKGLDALKEYFKVAEKYIRPFENQYRGKSIFTIREDESIFLSLAAYREHLLADTLTYAYRTAKNPEKLFVGAVVQNCFGKVNEDGTIDSSGLPCRTGLEVIGKNKKGKDMTKMSDAPPDKNGIDDFCKTDFGRPICERGQVRVLYVHASLSLGPAMARYYASKLWGGETYFIQCDSHLEFATHWDDKYIKELMAARKYPKAVLTSYPPGFSGHTEDATVRETPGARLCTCEVRDGPKSIIRMTTGIGYRGDEPRPTQVPFIAAGFFFARSEFLIDVPFDPFLPWCFMGEEIALSIRAWTSGWDIYAPRKNLIAHQYRPGRMGLPKFWESVDRYWHHPGINNVIVDMIVRRVKHMVGYPDSTTELIKSDNQEVVLTDMDEYSVGTERSWEEYIEFANLSVDHENGVVVCHPIHWCNHGEKD